MNRNDIQTALRGLVRPGGWLLAGTLAVGLAAGCNVVNDALAVQAPATVPADQLTSPGNAGLLVNGAIGDFECAYGAYVGLTSMLSHEMVDASETAARWVYDRREVNSNDDLYGTGNCQSLGVYTPLSTARWSADHILTSLQGWTDAQVASRQDLIARAAVYAGYSYVLLGEGFCEAAIDLSAPLSSPQLFAKAAERFTTAIAAAQTAGDDSILTFAYAGRARALADQDSLTAAAADAQHVPADFVYYATASTASSRRYNRIYAQNGKDPTTGGQALSVDSAYLDVTFGGVPDPRVPVLLPTPARVTSNGTPLYFQQKYNSLSDPLPITTGTEMQLIIALADVSGGQLQQAVNIINTLHDAVGLPHFQSTSPDSVKAQILWERRSALWLQGTRFWDIRHYNLPLVPAPGTPYKNGGSYGNTTCLPVPAVEANNNPNISG